MPARPRRVALNALFFEPERSAGTETYLRGLVPALADEFPRLRLTLVTTRRGAARLVSDGWRSLCDVVQMRVDEGQRLRRLNAEQISYPAFARREACDLVHSLASVAPIRPRLPSVITLHDVTFFHHQTFNPLTTFGMRQIVRRAAYRANALIAVSDATRDDACRTLALDPDCFVVVHNGPGQDLSVTPLARDALTMRLRLPANARIVLCVATVRPHKNQALLVRTLPHLPPDVVLVLAGHRERYAREVLEVASELGMANRVYLPGYVGAAELEGLWKAAECAAFPTLAEGFGLPVAEAIARGVPVACSDLAVLREVGGSVPLYFPPGDVRGAAAVLSRLLERHTAGRQTHGSMLRFSWAQAAQGTFEAYERALVVAHRS
jgi:glycosyltransferase involved in cell wall biosynthesis